MKLLGYVCEHGSIPLTKSGAFNRKFVDWAAVEFDWEGYTASDLYRVNKVLNEGDFPPLMMMHDLLLMAKLGRRLKGQFLLTPKGRTLVDDHVGVQQTLFQTLLCEYNLTDFDRDSDQEPPDWEIMLGAIDYEARDWVTIGYMLNALFGIESENVDYSSAKYQAAFWFWSTFVTPLSWLGLIECEQQNLGASIYTTKIRRTALWAKFLRFEHHLIGPVSKMIH